MKPLIYLSTLFLMACATPDHPSADTCVKDTACQQPDTKADQEAKQAVHEAELRKNEKRKKETN
jgi:hypothetical protein